MNHLFRVGQLVALNSVPVAGLLWAGWSDGTALTLYVCENLIMIVLVALRMSLHRKATNKRGHYVELKVSNDGGRTWRKKTSTYTKSFLLMAAFFIAGQWAFLFVVLHKLEWPVDLHALRQGVIAAAICLVIGFILDLQGLRQRPFIWIRTMADGTLWRICVVLITVTAGLWIATALDLPKAIFIVFASLKLFTDIANQFPQYNPDEAPDWLVRASRATGLRGNFAQYWRDERSKETSNAARDEEPFDGHASGTSEPVSISNG